MTERKVSSERVSALPPVYGLDVVAQAYVVEGECEQIEWGSDVLLPDDPSLVELTPLSQASSVIAGLKSEVADLRDEWQAEYDARLAARRERITAERDALEAYCKLQAAEARISSLEEENKRLRDALGKLTHLYESDCDPEVTARPGWLISALEDHNG